MRGLVMKDFMIILISSIYISFIPQDCYSSYKSPEHHLPPPHTAKDWIPPYRDSIKIHPYKEIEKESDKDILKSLSKSKPTKSKETFSQFSIPAKNDDTEIPSFR